MLQRGFARNPLETSINAYLIGTGARVVLVDTGAGELFGRVGGKLPEIWLPRVTSWHRLRMC